ncbi:hypothetical protein VKT23_012744 [Stygiomarasmius scandens]|uniref:Uncharacterized protein n=1 Tax=Marasmiellus scandens TaxID=2682957 RepID=A0ABR1J525_9AGAR
MHDATMDIASEGSKDVPSSNTTAAIKLDIITETSKETAPDPEHSSLDCAPTNTSPSPRLRKGSSFDSSDRAESRNVMFDDTSYDQSLYSFTSSSPLQPPSVVEVEPSSSRAHRYRPHPYARTRSTSPGSPFETAAPSMTDFSLSTDISPMGWTGYTSIFPPEISGKNMQYVSSRTSDEGGDTSSSFDESLSSDETSDSLVYIPFPSSSGTEEVLRLKAQVNDLERRHRRDEKRIQRLETQLVSSIFPSEAFKASWRARTDARIHQICSVNRAGNSLCVWHDSLGGRRMYSPRHNPAGYLHCQCSYEEALFEESLARHNVGSYLSRRDVLRMDPELRNPLLKLLQERYGYRDGDFERDPHTGNWVSGEGHAKWEEQISRGRVNPRRPGNNQNQ